MINELIHPKDAAQELNVPFSTVEALANCTFLEKQWEHRVIGGKTSDWWYLKKQVEELKGINTGALLGFHGQEAQRVEFEKWANRVGYLCVGEPKVPAGAGIRLNGLRLKAVAYKKYCLIKRLVAIAFSLC